ncbi:histone-lysine N-methyltransferase EHMT1-like [Paramacrobiotus metropolitanus]|uniref:histone-lysine N-methyltransferase EHMT1-like n=1 Tax=Paramacrobiotus metropolitanus TaxID=2943436 RepID=UPI002445925A|nr:histone-lysine N-methyltransferase EHMT1-like [Paramacrobiotus metropolitanus]
MSFGLGNGDAYFSQVLMGHMQSALAKTSPSVDEKLPGAPSEQPSDFNGYALTSSVEVHDSQEPPLPSLSNGSSAHLQHSPDSERFDGPVITGFRQENSPELPELGLEFDKTENDGRILKMDSTAHGESVGEEKVLGAQNSKGKTLTESTEYEIPERPIGVFEKDSGMSGSETRKPTDAEDNLVKDALDGAPTGLVSTDVAQLFFTAINKEWKISPSRLRSLREPEPEISVSEVAASVLMESTTESMDTQSDTESVLNGFPKKSIENGIPKKSIGHGSNGTCSPPAEMFNTGIEMEAGVESEGILEQSGASTATEMIVERADEYPCAHKPAEVVAGAKRPNSALEEGTSDISHDSINWEAKVRGISHLDCRIVNDLLPSLSPRKKPKIVQKEQVEITQQLNSVRLSCLCEEVIKLGAKGNVDRYALDVTKAWADFKGPSRVSWTPQGTEAASTVAVCQAKMSVDDKLYGCMRPIARSFVGNLYRPSPSHPLIGLCEVHCAGLRNHNCCPGCGVFCEVGEFRACSHKSGHLYHESCTERDKIGKVRCIHCLKPSSHVKKTIKNPGLVPVNFCAEDLDPQLLLMARRPPVSYVGIPLDTYYRDFPLGFRVACAYLPPSYAQELKEKLSQFDMGVQQEMEWLDLFQMVKDGDITGVLHFVCNPANLQTLYQECVSRRKSGNDLLDHFPLSGPVHLAIQRNHPIILSILLQLGFPLTLPDKDGNLPFEQAALANSFVSLDVLKKFYVELPPSAVREISLRKFLQQKRFDCVALLFRYELYDFGEFAFTRDEQQEALKNLFSCGNIAVISNLLECPHIVDQLRYGTFGSEVVGILMKNWRHRFAVAALNQLSIRLLSSIPDVFDDGPVGRKMLAASTGGALPAVGASKFFDGADDPVLVCDLSDSREMHPVEVVNRFDQTLPVPFFYSIQRTVAHDKFWSIGLHSDKSCRCENDCTRLCSCYSETGSSCLYTKDRLLDVDRYQGEPLYECCRLCRCSPTECRNRLVQNPSLGFFQVFKARDGTWGLRSKYALPRGFFVGKLTGSLAHMGTVNKVLIAGEKELHIVVVNADREEDFTGIITRDCGNYTRFLKMEARGNVMAVQVYTDNDATDVPQIGFFTKDVVSAFEPLVLQIGQLKTIEWSHGMSENRYKT